MNPEAQLRQLEDSLKQADPELALQKNVRMAQYTSLHLGGPVDLFAEPDTPERVQLLLL